jgi:hypothetical protein
VLARLFVSAHTTPHHTAQRMSSLERELSALPSAAQYRTLQHHSALLKQLELVDELDEEWGEEPAPTATATAASASASHHSHSHSHSHDSKQPLKRRAATNEAAAESMPSPTQLSATELLLTRKVRTLDSQLTQLKVRLSPPSVLRCAVLCCGAVLCCVVLCCAVFCCVVLCCAVMCRAVPCLSSLIT